MKSFPSASFAVLTFALSLGGHLVLLSWAQRAFTRVERSKSGLRVLCVVAAGLPMASRFMTMKTRTPVFDGIMAASLLELTFILVLALPLLAVRWAAGAKRLLVSDGDGAAMAPAATPAPAPREVTLARVDRRQAIETIGGV